MTTQTEEKVTGSNPVQYARLFVERLQAVGFTPQLFSTFIRRPVLMEELVHAAGRILKYRYETLVLDSYEAKRAFGIAVAYNAPYDMTNGGMKVDLVRKGTRGTPCNIGNDWAPLIGKVEARIVKRNLHTGWGRGAHTVMIKLRTPLPEPGR